MFLQKLLLSLVNIIVTALPGDIEGMVLEFCFHSMTFLKKVGVSSRCLFFSKVSCPGHCTSDFISWRSFVMDFGFDCQTESMTHDVNAEK